MAKKPASKKRIPTPKVVVDAPPVEVVPDDTSPDPEEEIVAVDIVETEVSDGFTADISTRDGRVYGSVSIRGGEVTLTAVLPRADVNENNRNLTRDITDAIVECFNKRREEFTS